jgi:tRNA (guanine-N7-)-methyltransferase
MEWGSLYPAFVVPESDSTGHPSCISQDVTVADIGCGFGGLLVSLSPMLSNELILGALTLTVTDTR